MEEINLIGQNIWCLEEKGMIKYVGPLLHLQNQQESNWIGIQWYNQERGKHQGNVKQIQYFECQPNTSGSLLKYNEKYFGITLLQGFFKRYFKNTFLDGNELLNDEELISLFLHQKKESHDKKEVQLFEDMVFKTSKKFKNIEFLGFERIYEIWKDYQKLDRICIDHYKINQIGQISNLSKMFTNLKVLSLENNLLHNWEQINTISQTFHDLEELYIGENYLNTNEDINNLKKEFCEKFRQEKEIQTEKKELIPFKNLKLICMRKMNLTWKKINKIKILFQNVEEIIINDNQCNDFKEIELNEKNFPNLKQIDLSNNDISSLEDMKNFKIYFKKLNLGSNKLKNISELICQESLTHLNLRENQISNLEFLNQVSKYKNLQSLKIGLNPLIQLYDKDHLKCLFFSANRKLKTLNGSELRKRERTDCEIYYLKNAFHEYFDKFKTDQFTYDLEKCFSWIENKFPLIQYYIQEYGNPYPYEERNLQSNPIQDEYLQQNRTLNIKKFPKNYCLIVFQKRESQKHVNIFEQIFPKNTEIYFVKKFVQKKLQNKQIELFLKVKDKPLDNVYKRINDYSHSKKTHFLVSNIQFQF